MRLSNLQVILILLLAGAVLITAVLKYASVAGRIPAAMWDICTTVIGPAKLASERRDEDATSAADSTHAAHSNPASPAITPAR